MPLLYAHKPDWWMPFLRGFKLASISVSPALLGKRGEERKDLGLNFTFLKSCEGALKRA